MATIFYTLTDEAPMLATYSFLPVVQAFASTAGVDVETRDISLAGRILALFPEHLTEDQRVGDALTELGELATTPEANIIKLPNISASMPQLKAAIAELQSQGFALPDYPDDPQTDEERDIRVRYDKVKGSAVNPVLREGNSDRRAPAAVKNYARKPPPLDGRLEHRQQDQRRHHGRRRLPLQRAVVVLAGNDRLTHPARRHRRHDHRAQGRARRSSRVRSSTPPSCARPPSTPSCRAGRPRQGRGRAVLRAPQGHDDEGLRPDHLRPRRACLPSRGLRALRRRPRRAGLDPNNGLGGILDGLDDLPNGDEIEAAIEQGLADGPRLAMVNSDKGITNLHVPSDVIVDASMPAMIRTSGHMWGPDGAEADTLAVIPDSSYAGVYQTVIDDCRVPTAPSTRPRWARCPTSASWPRRPRSTAATTRPSRSRMPARRGRRRRRRRCS
jgi:isocitrate dehydrogenase